jgi:hypothetical protein
MGRKAIIEVKIMPNQSWWWRRVCPKREVS